MLCGLEIKRLSEFFDAANILCPSRSSMYRVESKVIPHIMAVGSERLRSQIAAANKHPEGTVISCDEQHSRSHRPVGRAPYCSAVFIDDRTNKIIELAHASKKEAKSLGVKCLAKASRVLGLKNVAHKVTNIDMFVVDGCASTEKDLDEHVRVIRRHHQVRLNKDLWH